MLKAFDGKCPKCGSDNLLQSRFSWAVDCVYMEVECDDCGEKINLVYDTAFIIYAKCPENAKK